jgi:long-subunit fatty acid transport protein
MESTSYIRKCIPGLLALMLLIAPSADAQFVEDALRLNYGTLGSGARAFSMGTAYIAIADDFSAVFYNPAGLAQVRRFEISGGLRHTSVRNDVLHLGSVTRTTGSSTALDNLGIVIPVPTIQGSLTLAIGYNRVNDFTQVSSFEGFNENDSIIPDLFYSRDMMSYFLDLADSNGVPFYLGNLDQRGSLNERGSVNNWSLSGGIEAAPDVYLGLTLNLISGRYRHTFTFEEEDTRNLYDVPPDDLDYLLVEDRIDARLTGFNMIAGGLYTVNSFLRIGGTIQTPTRYSIEEDYDTYGFSQFSAPGDFLEDEFDAAIDYDVSTPWKFGIGASVQLSRLIVSAAVDYQDWSQLEFRNAPRSILDNNRIIRDELEGTTNFRLGAEFTLPTAPVAIRGGYIFEPSPYRNAPSEFNRRYITGGIGITLQNDISLDLGLTYGMWESDLFLYEFPAQNTWVARFVNEDLVKRSMTFTFRYRF